MRAFQNHRVLSFEQREMIRRRIAENEARLRGEIVIPKNPKAYEKGMSDRRLGRYARFLNPNPSRREDPGLLRQKIEQDRRILDHGSPRDLSRQERREIEKRAQEQREWLRKRMASRKDAQQMPVNRKTGMPNPRYQDAVKAFKREYDPSFQRVASEYVNNMRQLAGDSPQEATIEAIRPK